MTLCLYVWLVVLIARRVLWNTLTNVPQILMVLADHGPAVSGAHNTIVTARAGKDLVSSVVAGLLTVGPRFGGALDGEATYSSTLKRTYATCCSAGVNRDVPAPLTNAWTAAESAAMFSKAYDSGQNPIEFVTEMKRNNILIMGIGHRCECTFVHSCFVSDALLNF
jgi:ATP citrate (pro-S)-lyase